ncbi:hypothetical protein EDB85DRAFT_1898772 [Lactarius pseudohatsudake]|nr:hypothetical protein EDB85DRAFT_1898772 [Lactarius pseudohatsudake]
MQGGSGPWFRDPMPGGGGRPKVLKKIYFLGVWKVGPLVRKGLPLNNMTTVMTRGYHNRDGRAAGANQAPSEWVDVHIPLRRRAQGGEERPLEDGDGGVKVGNAAGAWLKSRVGKCTVDTHRTLQRAPLDFYCRALTSRSDPALRTTTSYTITARRVYLSAWAVTTTAAVTTLTKNVTIADYNHDNHDTTTTTTTTTATTTTTTTTTHNDGTATTRGWPTTATTTATMARQQDNHDDDDDDPNNDDNPSSNNDPNSDGD